MLASYRLIFDMRHWAAMVPDSEVEAHFKWVAHFLRRNGITFPKPMRMAFLSASTANTDGVVERIAQLSHAPTMNTSSIEKAWQYLVPDSPVDSKVVRFLG